MAVPEASDVDLFSSNPNRKCRRHEKLRSIGAIRAPSIQTARPGIPVSFSGLHASGIWHVWPQRGAVQGEVPSAKGTGPEFKSFWHLSEPISPVLAKARSYVRPEDDSTPDLQTSGFSRYGDDGYTSYTKEGNGSAPGFLWGLGVPRSFLF